MRSPSSPFSWRLTTSAAAAIGALVLYRFEPTPQSLYPSCVFHMLTGLQCPGCGATRAAYHLLHGDFAGAFAFNQLIFVLVPFLVAAAFWPRLVAKPQVAWTLAVVVIAYGVVRNLPFWPYPLV